MVIKALAESNGGETFISKIPSFWIKDLAKAMLPDCEIKEVGIRPGEKLHEVMVTKEDSMHTYEYENHFIIYPNYDWWDRNSVTPGGKQVEFGFEYNSGTNDHFLTVDELRDRLNKDL